ncbi:MAG: efflux RND transporter periplasmic adaptor subunit [Pseudomonadales bacterium]|nr:efflux RND transporter periplasmic adaptor subunit [Pseudomonadales bacterium]
MKRIILPIVILIVGVGIAAGIVATGPELKQQPPGSSAPLVRTWVASPQTVQMSSRTHGTVLPRTESELIPEVSGRITMISDSMVSGGFFKEGDELFQVETLDYAVALEQARASLASARSELSIAKRAHARQIDLARKQSTSESLRDDALNRLRIAEASLREAKARIARAERDLERTTITAPYDGRVRTERVDVGQFVNRGASVAMLYATDYAEVRLPVHDEELAYLDLQLDGLEPELESEPIAMLSAQFAGKEHTWAGKIVRTEGEIDPQTRMINLVAQVDAPYEPMAGRPPLAVGLFVEAEIHGREVHGIFVLPRSALQANSQVYVVTADRTIEFRDVEILRVVDEDVYVSSGFQQGETICLSTVSNAVEGMSVRPMEPTMIGDTDGRSEADKT